MKRFLCILCFLALLTGCASANQWGAEGELLTFLLRSGKYDDCTYVDHNYTGPDQQRVAMVISTEMNSRLRAAIHKANQAKLKNLCDRIREAVRRS